MTYLLIYQPLYNILTVFSFLFKGNVGWAIFVLAVLLRLALLPLNQKTMLAQNKLTKIQPKMKEIQAKHKQEPAKANQELMDLFKREKVNPYSSVVGMFIQIALFISLWFFFRQAIQSNDWTSHLYPFVKISPALNYIFLGFMDLRLANFSLVAFSVAVNFVLLFLQPTAPNQNKTMILFLPFVILFYWRTIPAAIIVYWIAMSLVGIIEAVLTKKVFKKQSQEESQT